MGSTVSIPSRNLVLDDKNTKALPVISGSPLSTLYDCLSKFNKNNQLIQKIEEIVQENLDYGEEIHSKNQLIDELINNIISLQNENYFLINQINYIMNENNLLRSYNYELTQSYYHPNNMIPLQSNDESQSLKEENKRLKEENKRLNDELHSLKKKKVIDNKDEKVTIKSITKTIDINEKNSLQGCNYDVDDCIINQINNTFDLKELTKDNFITCNKINFQNSYFKELAELIYGTSIGKLLDFIRKKVLNQEYIKSEYLRNQLLFKIDLSDGNRIYVSIQSVSKSFCHITINTKVCGKCTRLFDSNGVQIASNCQSEQDISVCENGKCFYQPKYPENSKQ